MLFGWWSNHYGYSGDRHCRQLQWAHLSCDPFDLLRSRVVGHDLGHGGDAGYGFDHGGDAVLGMAIAS